jgi:hypothetical protein
LPEIIVGVLHFQSDPRVTRSGDSTFTLDFGMVIPNAGLSFANAAKRAATGAI